MTTTSGLAANLVLACLADFAPDFVSLADHLVELVEAEKLDAFCRVVRAASTAADHAAFAEIGRAASKALQAKFGGGSITSAFAWLAGSSGQNALESVLVGEVEPVGTLSLQQMAEAVALARNAERLQEGS